MKVLRYMIKGIFPIAWFLFLTMLACHICIIDGEIDWLRVMLVYGIPYGIPYMISMFQGGLVYLVGSLY